MQIGRAQIHVAVCATPEQQRAQNICDQPDQCHRDHDPAADRDRGIKALPCLDKQIDADGDQSPGIEARGQNLGAFHAKGIVIIPGAGAEFHGDPCDHNRHAIAEIMQRIRDQR